jgi:hypothetical protein
MTIVLVSDGSPVFYGCKNNITGKLNAKVGLTILNFQCVIHQEVLCCKVLKENHIFKRVIEVTNSI